MTDFYQEALAINDQLVQWRHDLHRIPELSLNLPKTSTYVQTCLSDMSVPHKALVNGSCVVATLGKPGPCIMLRGDMDALPVREESGEPFASTNGCMHACGHDLHMSSLLGAAKLLKAHESELSGTVKFLFQPAEETFLGARAAIEDGALEDPSVDAAFALHVNGQLPLGTFVYRRGEMLASVYGFRIVIRGKGGHGSMPDRCVDPITAGVHVHLALQELVAGETGGLDRIVLTVGKFQAGTAANVIADTAELEGTLRTFDPDLRTRMIRRIGEVAQDVAATYRCTADIQTISDCPSFSNDARLVDACLTYLSDALPDAKQVCMPTVSMGTDDFAFIAQRVPSAYLFMGAAAEDTETHYEQHHPKIRFSDKALAQATATYAAVASRWLADNA